MGAEGDFEGAGPVDAALEGIFAEPVIDLAFDFGEEFGARGKQPGLGEEHEVLVAAEFPDEFVIAGAGEVEVGDAAEVIDTGFLAMDGIAAPADLGPKVEFGNAQ